MIRTLLLLAIASPAWADLEREVRCAEIGFSQSAERQDAAAFASFVDPDARFVTSSVMRGREAVVQGWSGFFQEGGPTIAWRPDVVEVHPSGELALSRGPYRSRRLNEAGETVESWGHFISTWRRSADGRWQVVFDSGGDHGMTPTDAERALLDQPVDCGEES